MNEPRVGSPRHEVAGTAGVHRRESYFTQWAAQFVVAAELTRQGCVSH